MENMINNKRLDHIGLCTNDVEADAAWYIETFGFNIAGKFFNNGHNVYFLEKNGMMYEMYQADPLLSDERKGTIDHISYNSDDIEADYKYCVEKGYKITTNGIEGISAFWENGVRFFKIESPTGEQVEFCQKL